VPDIFVSYAHVDNQPLHNQAHGWVTHFINNLRDALAQRLGRKDSYSLWQDVRLQGNDAVTPEIEQQVREAQTLVILFSQGWLASKWCQAELALFLESHADVEKRIFVIELERFNLDEKPPTMQDLLNYPFWRQDHRERVYPLGYPVPQMTDSMYFERLLDLSHDLANALQSLRNEPPTPEPVLATVYVAPVHTALYSQRQRVISELRQFEIAVLPEHNQYDEHMDEQLAQCSHFVQLLGTDGNMNVLSQQYMRAVKAQKPILQWRDPALDYSGAHVPEEQRQLLQGETVIAAPLADFSRMVREAVLPKPPEPSEASTSSAAAERMIFVHASQEDFERAQGLAAQLQQRGYGIALPRYQGEPERIRKSIERGYAHCDVLLLVYQCATADLIEDYLAEVHLTMSQRERRPLLLLCQCAQTEDLYFIPPGLKPLLCHADFDVHCLEQFLAEVEA